MSFLACLWWCIIGHCLFFFAFMIVIKQLHIVLLFFLHKRPSSNLNEALSWYNGKKSSVVWLLVNGYWWSPTRVSGCVVFLLGMRKFKSLQFPEMTVILLYCINRITVEDEINLKSFVVILRFYLTLVLRENITKHLTWYFTSVSQ